MNDKGGKAFSHVFTFSPSNFIQDYLARVSRSICQSIPGLSSLLLPRVNPLVLFLSFSIICIFITNICIEVYDAPFADTVLGFFLAVFLTITVFPLASFTGKILLQTTPGHMIGHLDKCLREASTMDGVLEFRNEHFWTLGYNNLVGSLHVRVRRDANEQQVLSHLSNRLSNLVSNLTIQVFKDEWSWQPSPRLLHKDYPLLKHNTIPVGNSNSVIPVTSSLSSSIGVSGSPSHNSMSSSASIAIPIASNDKSRITNDQVVSEWIQNV